MMKLRLIFSSVLIVFLMVPGILIWRTSDISTDPAAVFPEIEKGPDSALETKSTSLEEPISLNESLQATDNNTNSRNFGYYETIEETIARIKRDVYVTGVIIAAPGQEIALFQIEGMTDRPFNINTQLMDGFIITEITNRHVVLKNQTGDEAFSLRIQVSGRDAAAELLSEKAASNVVD
jgi:hypothetical protein